MPIICIGPICFPIWGLIPVILLFVKKFWGKIAAFLGFAPPAAAAASAADMEATLAGLDASSSSQPRPPLIAVKFADQLENLKSSSKLKEQLLVVKFGAQWCAPCKAIQPFYERLSAAPGATFCTVDADEADGALKSIATSLPTFVVYGAKKELARVVGADQAAVFSMLQAAGLFGTAVAVAADAAAAAAESKQAFDASCAAAACKS